MKRTKNIKNHQLEQAICQTLASLPASSSIAVAFSGGVDSSALLYAATQCWPAKQILAIHINHNFSEDAIFWQNHCADQAKQLNVKFVAVSLDIAIDKNKGLESSARLARYAQLDHIAAVQSIPLILLGHHADDQAETILMRILRGTGLLGLRGMAPTRKAHSTNQNNNYKTHQTIVYARPWLTFSRSSIVQYASNRIGWINDASNDSEKFTRNRIRKLFAKQIEPFFPAYRTTLTRLSQHASEAVYLLDQLADEDLLKASLSACNLSNQNALILSDEKEQPICGINSDQNSLKAQLLVCFKKNNYALSILKLQQLDHARLKNALRRWLNWQNLAMPTEQHLLKLIIFILGKQNCFIWHHEKRTYYVDGHLLNWRVIEDNIFSTLSKSSLFFSNQNLHSNSQINISQPSTQVLSLSDLIFDQNKAILFLPIWNIELLFEMTHSNYLEALPWVWLTNKAVTARARQGGERFYLKPNGPSRSLKNIFQENKISFANRRLPLIYIDDALTYIPAIGFNFRQLSLIRESCLIKQEVDQTSLHWVKLSWRFKQTNQ